MCMPVCIVCWECVPDTCVYACMYCVLGVCTGHVCVCLYVLCAGSVYRTRVCMPVCFVCTGYITILGLATKSYSLDDNVQTFNIVLNCDPDYQNPILSLDTLAHDAPSLVQSSHDYIVTGF